MHDITFVILGKFAIIYIHTCINNNTRHNLRVLSTIDFSAHGSGNTTVHDANVDGSGEHVAGGSNASGGNSAVGGWSGSSSSTRDMFQRRACAQRMVREYFVFVGRLSAQYAEVASYIHVYTYINACILIVIHFSYNAIMYVFMC